MKIIIKATFVVALLVLFGCNQEKEHDVAWYREHRTERKAKLQECLNGTRDNRIFNANCDNAKVAEGAEIFSNKKDVIIDLNGAHKK
ncbi:EexN family lipoprotein [Solidesulfovibrio alcoholivorans]|uniref:EexN family lipoprotein n=1 Tax=Solidesulfovibrio alcoholivorans TaxID=81406 RepID=UPI000A8DE924|nr:EexN family lipoprotein [Solidesulfovibrio alcoholivorans]